MYRSELFRFLQMRTGFSTAHGQLSDGPRPPIVAELDRDVVVSDLVQTRVVDRLPLAPLRDLAVTRDGARAKTEGGTT